MTTTKKINQNETISKSLLHLLNEKVKGISKKSNLKTLNDNDIKDLKGLDVVLGVYECRNELNNEIFLVYKIFIVSDVMIKGSYKGFNLISNQLLSKNKDKQVAAKVNIYHQDNQKMYNTFIEFIKNKLNEEELKPGEYILQGFKLIDLLEIEI